MWRRNWTMHQSTDDWRSLTRTSCLAQRNPSASPAEQRVSLCGRGMMRSWKDYKRFSVNQSNWRFLNLVTLLQCQWAWFFAHCAKTTYRTHIEHICQHRQKKHVVCTNLCCKCRKSAVHRSAVRSNASSKFLQNYAGGRVRQPRTPNTSAERKFPKPNYTKAIPCQKDCFTLDSHMLTSSSFFSLQTQHDQSRGNTNTTNKQNKNKEQEDVFPVSVCLMSSYVTQQLLFMKWTSDTSPSSRCLNW